MTAQSLEILKQNLNFRITKIDKEESLRQIEKVIDLVEHSPNKKQSDILKKLAKPMREKLDLEELKREQNWKPSTKEEVDAILKDFDWQISDEEFFRLLKEI
jgi:hypothetical protein